MARSNISSPAAQAVGEREGETVLAGKPLAASPSRLPPDRLSVETASPFFVKDAGKKVEVFFNGIRQTNCAEYCISEGWIRRYKRTALGTFIFERGNPVITKHFGIVEVTEK